MPYLQSPYLKHLNSAKRAAGILSGGPAAYPSPTP